MVPARGPMWASAPTQETEMSYFLYIIIVFPKKIVNNRLQPEKRYDKMSSILAKAMTGLSAFRCGFQRGRGCCERLPREVRPSPASLRLNAEVSRLGRVAPLTALSVQRSLRIAGGTAEGAGAAASVRVFRPLSGGGLLFLYLTL